MSQPIEKPDHTVLKQILEEAVPFHRLLGLRFQFSHIGDVEVLLPYRDDFIGDMRRPALHGGVISVLFDIAGGAAVMTQIDVADRVSTIDLLVDYMHPAPKQNLIARAKIMRLGKKIALTQLECMAENAPHQLLATGRATYHVRRDTTP